MNTDLVTFKEIYSKKIYIVRNHHEVIIPWSDYASKSEAPPVLLTFDHHIDTRSAFYRHSRGISESDWSKISEDLINRVDIHNENSISKSLKLLRNYEHIDFSLRTGILSDAVIFSLMNAGICKDFSNENIYYIDPDCISTCDKISHDESCKVMVSNNVIENDELLFKLRKTNKFIPGFYSFDTINRKYILDIDLDCFHTKKAIHPYNIDVLNYLIRNAEIITIATEPDYVQMEKIDQDIDADYLLEKLLSIITQALSEQV